ncbi:Granzyme A [Acipenser ruthenus]|uniref:Granzyme A n=1 Tax=Acipenser ruthenus TaxID=7906 RepID=A0A444UT92_ACIRT|nr:Granzyme A [Acipenser ruthenus]
MILNILGVQGLDLEMGMAKLEVSVVNQKCCVKNMLQRKHFNLHFRYDSKLKQKVMLNSRVGILKLPEPSSTSDLKAGTKCHVAGWGSTKLSGEGHSDVLREVNVTIVDQKTCNSQYHKLRQEITKNMLCAGNKKRKQDICNGDSGGPLLCEDTYRGIASFGTRKCQGKLPSVYTRLTREYLGWIQHVMKNY